MITNPDIQLLAWFLAVIALVMSIYIILLIHQRANRWFSLVLLFLAIDGYAVGSLAGSKSVEGARLGLYLCAALTPAIIPGLLLILIQMVKPKWLMGRERFAAFVLKILITIPFIFVALDVLFGTHLVYRGFPSTYLGGYIDISSIMDGPAGVPIFILNIIVTLFVTLVVLVLLAGYEKTLPALIRGLVWMMAVVHILLIVFLVFLHGSLGNGIATLAILVIYSVLFMYVAFQQPSNERLFNRTRLQTRLAILTVGIAVPLTITVATLSSNRISLYIQDDAYSRLQFVSRSLAENISGRLEDDYKALVQMVLLPDMKTMDPALQTPALVSMAKAHTDFYLVSTTDTTGFNVARSDDKALLDYKDRYWFQQIRNGAKIAYQLVKGRTSGVPALVMSVPIRDEQGILLGVGMFATELTRFAELVKVTNLGDTGYAYILNENNLVAADPNPDLSLRDFSNEPQVIQLREESTDKVFSYRDSGGKEWLVSGVTMANGWMVIAQQQRSEVFRNINVTGRITAAIIVIGSLLLLILLWLAIHRAMQPINDLTETASAIASGNYTRVAKVESDDEIGTLARAFNAMTAQLRNSLSGLEKQVAERTLDLEERSSYLQISSEVGRIAASILDPQQLAQEVVDLIRERFNLYYVGLFQLDQTNEWAILKAGTGKAGQNMITKGHRIRVGSGMIGWCIANSQPRIALEAGGDTVRLATTELPETRSEVALPLRSRNQVIGALSLQSTIIGAFDKENIAVFQILADEVAIALDNARLFAGSQETLTTMQKIYGEMSSEAWKKLLHEDTAIAFRGDVQGVNQLQDVESVSQKSGGKVDSSLEIPITVRGNVIGVLDTKKPDDNPAWNPDEITVMHTVAEQLGLALESAQLYRESQYRAERERLISQITAQMRESLDVDTVLKTAAHEIQRALGLKDVSIQLGETPHQEKNGIQDSAI